jgi:hypothetical protein
MPNTHGVHNDEEDDDEDIVVAKSAKKDALDETRE